MTVGPDTVPCVYSCGQRISPDATVCPKCGRAQAVERLLRPCRICGTPLPKQEHRYFVSHGLVFSEVHRACPYCCDPQPLWTTFDTLYQTAKFIFSIIVVVLAIGIGLILARNYQAYQYEFSPMDAQHYVEADYDIEPFWEESRRSRGCSVAR